MNTLQFEALLREKRTLTMGVLNVTPDSFSDGGVFLEVEQAVARAGEMLAEGADIIDIGGQSTRPPGLTYGSGAGVVDPNEELRRVLPVINRLASEYPGVIISIDTVKAEVARQALESGATIVNDVSGATEDREMFDVAKEHDAPVILMHGYGPDFTKPRIEDYHFQNVVSEVFDWLGQRIAAARKKGIGTVLADIGFGFSKTAEDNIRLLRMHRKFTELEVPLVLGVSRKSTIGKMLGGALPLERASGSLAAAIYGAVNGAKIIRTHDVKQTVEALRVLDMLKS